MRKCNFKQRKKVLRKFVLNQVTATLRIFIITSNNFVNLLPINTVKSSGDRVKKIRGIIYLNIK